MENRETRRRIESTTKVTNRFNQDSAAGTKAIKRMVTEADLGMMLKREPGHREATQIFQQNTGPMLIKIFDEEAKKVRMKVTDKETRNNMRHHGN